MFQKTDVSGNLPPVTAILDHGTLKLKHNSYGKHPITDIGGTAKGAIFYADEGRLGQEKRMLQFSDGIYDSTELTRVQLNTQAAESKISDTHIADEMLKNSSSKILMQAGQALLAQNASSFQKRSTIATVEAYLLFILSC